MFASIRQHFAQPDRQTSDGRFRADEGLLARLRARDPESLGEAYTMHGGLVYATAMRVLGDHQRAEECTQDVFMRLWRSADTIDPGRARLTTWLYAVARNRAISMLRGGPAEAVAPIDELPDQPAPDDTAARVERADDARRIVEALAELPDDQRQVVALAYFEGLSQREIADALDVPLGTVKGRVRLAFDRLRTSLEDQRGSE